MVLHHYHAVYFHIFLLVSEDSNEYTMYITMQSCLNVVHCLPQIHHKTPVKRSLMRKAAMPTKIACGVNPWLSLLDAIPLKKQSFFLQLSLHAMQCLFEDMVLSFLMYDQESFIEYAACELLVYLSFCGLLVVCSFLDSMLFFFCFAYVIRYIPFLLDAHDYHRYY